MNTSVRLAKPGLGTGWRRLMVSSTIAVAVALTLPACAQDTQNASAAETTKSSSEVIDQGSYSLGVSMGEQFGNLGLTTESLSVERLVQGLQDALNKKAKMGPEHEQQLMLMMQSARTAMIQSNEAAAQKFLADNGKRKGVVTTASGLQYQQLTAGKGESPKAGDEVTVHYRGTLLDGTQFDSSIERGQPVTFPLQGLIEGWQEALLLMKPGAKWNVYIPPQLAYGNESPPPIPPGSMLQFEIELLGVKPAGEAPSAPAHAH